MDRLIYTAMTGASQTLSRQSAVANNLANATTTGYRAEERRLRAVQVLSPAPLPTRAFVVDATFGASMKSGPIQATGRNFDVAIRDSGWIALAMPDGSEAYTRNGSLQVDVNGVLQTREGIPVQGDGGSITVPPETNVTIAADGTVSVIPVSGAQNTVNSIGRIKLVNPPVEDMVRDNDGLFRLRSNQAADPDPKVTIASGYLEGSNVNPVEEMVNMISLARQFEMQMKILTTASTDDQTATQILTNY